MNESVNARKIVDRIIEISGLKQKDVASQILDISATNLSNKIRRNSIDILVISKWANDENVNINWLMTGEGTIYLEKKSGKGDNYQLSLQGAGEVEQNKNEYDLHGGWEPREIKVSLEIKKTLEILESDTIYRIALVANINAFHHAMQNEKNLEAQSKKTEKLEERIAALEKRLEQEKNES